MGSSCVISLVRIFYLIGVTVLGLGDIVDFCPRGVLVPLCKFPKSNILVPKKGEKKRVSTGWKRTKGPITLFESSNSVDHIQNEHL